MTLAVLIVGAVTAVAAAIAAGGAWRSATASREAARQTRLAWQIEVHAKRIDRLAELHGRMSWVTEGGRPRSQLMKYERLALVMGLAPGTTIVQGVEMRGLVRSTGLDLPACLNVCETMMTHSLRANTKAAVDEIEAAMNREHEAMRRLEKEAQPRGRHDDVPSDQQRHPAE